MCKIYNNKNKIWFIEIRSIFVKRKKNDILLKRIRFVPVKEKKMINFRFVKEKSNLLLETNKKRLSKEDPHSWEKFIMHVSHTKKKTST